MRFRGLITALISPFKDGCFDEAGFIQNIHDQLAAGVSGLVVLGTTGESPTLSPLEQERAITLALQTVAGRIPVIAGCGGNCTQTTIDKAIKCQRLGADALILITPYYNRPTQEGLYQHFANIANAVDLPIMLYNNPVRTAVNLSIETLKRLSEIPNIVAIKDCSGSTTVISEMLLICDEFSVLSGDDIMAFPTMALGCHGVVSTMGNLVPERMVALVEAMQRGDLSTARALHFELLPLFLASGLETNPMPVKEMMRLSGKPAGSCRLPLCEVQPETRKKLQAVLEQITGCHR
ncbi:MAG: 4-hydroxy-tetrahydrodipicolinate synthase [Chlamydiales bacterium]|nr:4-hydroxy-tetrahydrodipicolinate synthase [Chlamydiales bacterium]